MTTVPDFFQDESEEALRSQVEWQEQHLGLGERFFARLLREDQRRFSSWARDADTLPRDKEDVLRDWWRTVLHLLSFQNFDEGKVRALLERMPVQLVLDTVEQPYRIPARLADFDALHARLDASREASAG